jgi:hypothetical protein
MEFPRLTSGNLGALTFAHVNEMFRRIEQLEAVKGQPTNASNAKGRIFVAEVTDYDPDSGRAAFHEVTRADPNSISGAAWLPVAGGATSVQGDNVFAHPLINSGGQIGRICYAFARNGELAGTSFYETIAPRGAALYYLAASTGNGPWTYLGYEAQYVNGGWVPDPNVNAEDFITLYNGCENIEDTPTLIGTGTVLPAGVTATRQPIRVNIVVPAIPDANGILAFALPNGYEIECPP